MQVAGRLAVMTGLAVSLCAAGTASAQVLSLEFRDGRVNLVAENVTVRSILDEWARDAGAYPVCAGFDNVSDCLSARLPADSRVESSS